VFLSHYQQICFDAWTEGFPEHAQYLCQDILRHFCQSWATVGVSSSLEQRRSYLNSKPFTWRSLKTNSTCLSCLLRGPDAILPCGHSLCYNCARLWGINVRIPDHSFQLRKCYLCFQSLNYIVHCPPPTVSPIVFALDGGGIRGVITLRFLQELERRIPLPLWQIPNLTVGTSAGML
jgi:hypothetical protein